MPTWPAWLLGASFVACAVPAFTAPSPDPAKAKCATVASGAKHAAALRCRRDAVGGR